MDFNVNFHDCSLHNLDDYNFQIFALFKQRTWDIAIPKSALFTLNIYSTYSYSILISIIETFNIFFILYYILIKWPGTARFCSNDVIIMVLWYYNINYWCYIDETFPEIWNLLFKLRGVQKIHVKIMFKFEINLNLRLMNKAI